MLSAPQQPVLFIHKKISKKTPSQENARLIWLIRRDGSNVGINIVTQIRTCWFRPVAICRSCGGLLFTHLIHYHLLIIIICLLLEYITSICRMPRTVHTTNTAAILPFYWREQLLCHTHTTKLIWLTDCVVLCESMAHPISSFPAAFILIQILFVCPPYGTANVFLMSLQSHFVHSATQCAQHNRNSKCLNYYFRNMPKCLGVLILFLTLLYQTSLYDEWNGMGMFGLCAVSNAMFFSIHWVFAIVRARTHPFADDQIKMITTGDSDGASDVDVALLMMMIMMMLMWNS